MSRPKATSSVFACERANPITNTMAVSFVLSPCVISAFHLAPVANDVHRLAVRGKERIVVAIGHNIRTLRQNIPTVCSGRRLGILLTKGCDSRPMG